MDCEELEVPVAQNVISTGKKTKTYEIPVGLQLAKKLAEHNRRVREEKKKGSGVKQQPESTASSFSLMRILSVASILLSLTGIYYERKEVTAFVDKPKPQP